VGVKYKSSDELTYGLLKKEHARLLKLEKKAEAEYNEYMNIHHELIAIRQEFAKVLDIKDFKKQKPLLDALIARSKRADEITQKDLSKLTDKHHQLKMDLSKVAHELSTIEFRLELRGRNA